MIVVANVLGLVLTTAAVAALLAYRQQLDRRRHAANVLRADVHAGATRALGL